MERSERELTGTAYAILGLLGVQSWSAYELTKQMERSVDTFWPRASSRVYAEVKRLADAGLADATKERVGRRPRTVYSITADGRAELEAWLRSPGRGLSVEFEALAKVFFADQGDLEGLQVNLHAALEWARDRKTATSEVAASIREDGGAYPDRLAVNALVFAFKADMAAFVERWATWAIETTSDWPDDADAWVPPMEVFDAAEEL